MLLLLPPVLLLALSLFIFVLHFSRIRPALAWLVGFMGSLAAWILVLVLHDRLPYSISIPPWQPPEFFPSAAHLVLDDFSWPFAVAITTLVVVGMVVSLVNQASLASGTGGWKEWVVIAAIAGVSLLAVLPGDLLTLVIAWTALDFIEYALWASFGFSSLPASRPVVFLGSRLAGTLLLTWTAVISLANGYSLDLQSLDITLIPLMLIALGIRGAVLPLSLAPAATLNTRDTHGILLLLAPQAATLLLVNRIASLSGPAAQPIWLVGLALASLFSALAWFSGSNAAQGRGYWLPAVSGLALAAGSNSLPGASLAWSMAALLAGGLIMMSSLHNRFLKPILLLGAFSLSSLPFSLTWQSVGLYAGPISLELVIFFLAQLLLLAAYLRFAWQARPGFPLSEPWKPGLYLLAMLLYPAMALLVYLANPYLAGLSTQPALLASWPGFALLGLYLLGLAVSRRVKFNLARLEGMTTALSSLDWHHRVGNWIFKTAGGLFRVISRVMEGQAGVLWAFLILILLLSLMAQFGAGG